MTSDVRIFRLAVILALLGVILPTHLVAGEAPVPSEQQFRVWQDSITKGNVQVMYETSYKLYRLPFKPWPESARKLLLTIIEKYDAFEAAITEGKPIDWTGKPVDLGHYLGDLVEMATWQADSRFVPFLAENLGGGTLPARGLAAIGEPAFDQVIQELHRDGWSSQRGAAKALELMLKADLPFLRAGAKRDRARESLLRVARSRYYLSRKRSIDALRYFNNKAVFALLDSLSQHDMYTIDGRYPVRKRAQEAMHYIRSQGDDRQ